MKKWIFLFLSFIIVGIFTTIVFHKTNQPSIDYYKGNYLFKIEKYDKAIIHFEKAISKRKNFINATKKLCASYYYIQEYEKAKNCYKKLENLETKISLPSIFNKDKK